jgi:hypothetical protein
VTRSALRFKLNNNPAAELFFFLNNLYKQQYGCAVKHRIRDGHTVNTKSLVDLAYDEFSCRKAVEPNSLVCVRKVS